MNTNRDPREIVEQLLNRSTCSVQVAAVIADKWSVHSWGWNSSGSTGMGLHAEAHALLRSNRSRLSRSTVYVASQRKRNQKPINSKPCEECQKLLQGVKSVIYRDANSTWVEGWWTP